MTFATSSSFSPTYVGNGVAVTFPTVFVFIESESVVPVMIFPDGAESELLAGFTVSGAGTTQGTVTFVAPVSNGQSFYLRRKTETGQPVSVRNGGRFNPRLHEEAWDRLGMQIQEVRDASISAEDVTDLIEKASTQVDGLLRSSLAEPSGADLVKFTHGVAGSVPRTLSSVLRERVSVLDFIPEALHATIRARTENTDVRSYFQSAASLCSAQGRDLYIPAGRYFLSSGVVFDGSAALLDTSPRPCIYGDGPTNSVLEFGPGNFDGFTILGGPQPGAGWHLHSQFEGFSLHKGDKLGRGMFMDNCAFFGVSHVFISGWDYGYWGNDVLSCAFHRFGVRNGKKGFFAQYVNGSRPNAISFFNCHLASNDEYGALFGGAGNVTFYGGSIEGNGGALGAGVGWGLKLQDSGNESGVAVAIHGTYFEANRGAADVWVAQTTADHIAVSITGATFNRINSGIYTDNNIRINNSGSANVWLSVAGCGFRHLGSYAPNAGRPCIATTNAGVGGAKVRVNTLGGNMFSSSVDSPESLTNIAHVESSIPTAWGLWTVSGGVVTALRAKNISGVVRNAAGDYTVTLQEGAAILFPQATISADLGDFRASCIAINSAQIQIRVRNSAGTLADPGGFGLSVFALQ